MIKILIIFIQQIITNNPVKNRNIWQKSEQKLENDVNVIWRTVDMSSGEE